MIKELIKKNRSYRRFDQQVNINRETLNDLVELARYSPSGANLQPLKFYLSCDEDTNEIVFGSLAWAGYLKDWDGPSEGEKPSAYIVILGDKTIRKDFGVDPGIMAQSMLLGAVEKGLGGCIFASIKRDALHKDLKLDEQHEILLVLALGKPVEKVVVDDLKEDGDIKYWREPDGTHHVPKRKLADLIVNND